MHTSSPLIENGAISVNPKTTPSDLEVMTLQMAEQKELHSPSVVEGEASGLAQRSTVKSVLLVLIITLVMIVNVRPNYSYLLQLYSFPSVSR